MEETGVDVEAAEEEAADEPTLVDELDVTVLPAFMVVVEEDAAVEDEEPSVQPFNASDVMVVRSCGEGAWNVSSTGSAQP